MLTRVQTEFTNATTNTRPAGALSLCFTLAYVKTAAVRFFVVLAIALVSPHSFGQSRPPSKPASNFATLSAQANAARDTDRLDDALTLYRKALALRPNWAEGWWSLGTIAYDRNSYSDASRAFQRVITLAPANGTAYVMLGLSEFELGHDALALKHLQKGMALGLDKDPDLRRVALLDEGILLQRAGRFQSARDVLGQMCLQGMQNKDVEYVLGMTSLRQANKTVPPAGSEDEQVTSGVGHAACLASQKKFEDARLFFNELVNRYPKYPAIHYAFGVLLTEASDLSAAVAEFK